MIAGRAAAGLSISADPVRVEGESEPQEDVSMAQYLLNVIQPGETPPPDLDMDKIRRDVGAFNQELKDAGAWVFSAALQPPSTATVVRAKDGEVDTTDGPFAESKEFVGGFTIVEADDLDAALEWGRKASAATTLPIEVRPFVDHH
jgi:hypothetical protein